MDASLFSGAVTVCKVGRETPLDPDGIRCARVEVRAATRRGKGAVMKPTKSTEKEVLVRRQIGLLTSIILALVMSAAVGSSGQRILKWNGIPSPVDVAVTAGAAGDEDLAHGVYLFHLKCSADISCEFDRLTLNECTPPKDGEAQFSPRMDIWSTTSGLLAVRQPASNKIELTGVSGIRESTPGQSDSHLRSGQATLQQSHGLQDGRVRRSAILAQYRRGH